jgi:hypothetical protein
MRECGCPVNGGCNRCAQAFGEFIAHARTDIPLLLAALELAIDQRDAALSALHGKGVKGSPALDAQLIKILTSGERK